MQFPFSSRRIYEYQERIPRNQKKGGGKKPVVFGKQAAHTCFAPYQTYVRVRGEVFGSTPLLSKYCPVVPEVKTGKPTYIHWAACFPHSCGALAKRTLLAGSSTQTRSVEYFISRDIIGEEADTTSFKNAWYDTRGQDQPYQPNMDWTSDGLQPVTGSIL